MSPPPVSSALGSVSFDAIRNSFLISITARHTTMMCCAKPADDLSWLRTEFHLSDTEMARVRELHNGYLPKCADLCAKIAAKKSELESALGGSTNITAEARVKMDDLASLRAQKLSLKRIGNPVAASPRNVVNRTA